MVTVSVQRLASRQDARRKHSEVRGDTRTATPASSVERSAGWMCYLVMHPGHPLHPAPSPAVSTLSCHWIQVGSAERVRLVLRNAPSLQSKAPRKSRLHTHSPPQSPQPPLKSCGVGQVAKCQLWTSLEAVVTNLHAGGSGHSVVVL